jgi:cytoskeleton protein RodZ
MSDENITEIPSQATPGELLAAARKAKGMTLEEVSDTLHILLSNLRAIEENRFADVRKGATFVRGYLRRYGEHLGLDGESLVALYNEQFAPPEAKSSGVRSAARKLKPSLRVKPARRSSRSRKMLLQVSLLLVLLIAVAGILLQSGGLDGFFTASPTPATQPAMLNLPTEQPVPELVDPDSESTREEGAQETLPDVPASVETADTGEAYVAQDETEADASLVSVRDSLNFELTSDSWIEVRDADGNRLYADLVRAGTQVALEGNAPFSVIVGDGRGVTIRYNGRVLNYSYARNGYAEFTVP